MTDPRIVEGVSDAVGFLGGALQPVDVLQAERLEADAGIRENDRLDLQHRQPFASICYAAA